MDFSSPYKKQKVLKSRRWYDDTFVRKYVESLESVPPYKQDYICGKIIEAIEAVFKNEINRKVNTNKYHVLGMYKQFERRRWYDQNQLSNKAVNQIFSLVDQRSDLQKLACASLIEILGEYYIGDDVPKPSKKASEPVPQKPKSPAHLVSDEELIPEEPAAEAPPPKTNKDKLLVSGEKLFVKRERKKKKKSDKPKPSM